MAAVSVLIGLPRDGRLLADAGLRVVAHAGSEQLPELVPLGVAELDRAVVAAAERLQPALQDVRRDRHPRGTARAVAERRELAARLRAAEVVLAGDVADVVDRR